MKELKVEIVTPTKIAYEGNINSINIPGAKGNFQVLFNHAPLMSSIDVGVVKIEETSGNKNEFAIGGGTVEVLNNKVVVLAQSFEAKEEIDLKRAEDAKERAQKRLKNAGSETNIDFARAENALKRAINRIKLAK